MKTFSLFFSPEGDAGGSGGGGGAAPAVAAPAGGDSGQSAAAAPATGSHQGAFDIRQHLDDTGSFKPDWFKAAGVSENLAKKFTRPEALARSYESLESKISAKGIIQPGPNASQEERNAYYKALGRPDKPEDYAFQKPDKIGDKTVPDAAWDSKRAEAWQKELYDAGLSKEQAQKVMQASIKESLTGMDMIQQAQAQSIKQGKDALAKEWGTDYDRNLGAAIRAAEQFGGEELKNHPALGNDPVLIKALAKIGLATQERPGANIRQQAGENRLSPADAKAEAQQLTKAIADRTKADRQWAASPEAAQMKERKSALFKVAYPDQK